VDQFSQFAVKWGILSSGAVIGRFPLRRLGLLAGVGLVVASASLQEAWATDPNLEKRRNSCSSVTLFEVAPQIDINRARNQPMGWCYAYSAADLFSIKLGKPISAVAIASNYYRNIPKAERLREYRSAGPEDSFLGYEGGVNRGVLNAALLDGRVCTEASVSSEFEVFRPDSMSRSELRDRSQRVNQEYIDSVLDLEGYHSVLKHWNREKSRGRQLKDTDCSQGVQPSEVRRVADRLFPGINIDGLMEIASRVSRDEFYSEVVKRSCEPVLIPKQWRVYEWEPEVLHSEPRGEDAAEITLTVIDQQLKKRNPVMIGISSETLTVPESGYRGKTFRDIDHSVLVVGREWMESTQECYYQLKNSWGLSCKDYPSALCKDGVLWVREKDMKTMTGAVTWVQ